MGGNLKEMEWRIKMILMNEHDLKKIVGGTGDGDAGIPPYIPPEVWPIQERTKRVAQKTKTNAISVH